MVTKQRFFGSCVIISVLLAVWMDVTSGMISIQLIPEYPVIGRSVILSVTGITEKIQSIVWYKGLNTDKKYQILSYFPADKERPQSNGALYNSRMMPFPNGSLQISNLNKTDEGIYIVMIQQEKSTDTSVYLTIYDLLDKPTITASTLLPRENDAFNLTCMSTYAETIIWSRVPPGTTLSSNNRTLIFFRISCMDSGKYQCVAMNPVSRKTSDPYTLTLACPGATTVTSWPQKPEIPAVTGSPASTTCSLGGGEIAAIVIGTAFGIFILEVIVYFVLKAKRNNGRDSVYENAHVSGPNTHEMTLPGTQDKTSQESNYEQLRHKDKSIYSTIERGKH